LDAPKAKLARDGLLRAACVSGMLALLVACGGGGGSSDGTGVGGALAPSPPTSPPTSPPAPPPVAAPTISQITLQSEPGDYVGGGRAYSYTKANARINVTWSNGLLSIEAVGDEDWQGDFQSPALASLQVARYDNALRYPSGDPSRAAMRWYGLGRGCATATGWFAVDQVAYTAGGVLDSFVLRFERHCEGATAALRGEIRWSRTDPTAPPPVADPPATLWQPQTGSVPASGNFLYIESEQGDHVGQGRKQLFVPRNTLLLFSGSRDTFSITADGAENWTGVVSGPEAQRLKRGYFPGMTRLPFINPTRGGMGWVGEGRGCADPKGWMAIDRIDFAPPPSQNVIAIELRFEQRCQPDAPALRGALRWTQAEANAPAAPEPSGSPGQWRPAAGAVPDGGTYIYLSGEKGEPISGGRDYLFTPANAVISVREFDAVADNAPLAGALSLRVGGRGEDAWSLDTRSNAAPTPWRIGLYRDLPTTVLGDLTQPRFSLSGRGQGCSSSLAWLVVDHVVYDGNQLRELDLRFEQRCQSPYGTTPAFALRGEVHWRADDSRQTPGPIDTGLPSFWRPPAGTSPTDRNYLQIESTRNDFVGEGAKLYTQAEAAVEVSTSGNQLHLKVTGDEGWEAVFQAMASQSRLAQGYYAGVRRYPFHDPARGGMAWSGQGRGCNRSSAGFVIDDIEYLPQGDLQSVKLRFEQHCESSITGASWGELHWRRGDPTQPPGPASAPAELWLPPPGAVPATGNYLYFESDPDEFIGSGQTLLVTAADGQFSLAQQPNAPLRLPQVRVTANVGATFPWELGLRHMSSLDRLAPGYYGAIRGFPLQNPAKGGLAFGGDGRGCNTVEGWFVVDSVAYQGDTISSLSVRFAQNCEDTGWLRGALRWQSP
jgi:hypothetical protein